MRKIREVLGVWGATEQKVHLSSDVLEATFHRRDVTDRRLDCAAVSAHLEQPLPVPRRSTDPAC